MSIEHRRKVPVKRQALAIELGEREAVQAVREEIASKIINLALVHPDKFSVIDIEDCPLPHTSVTALVKTKYGRFYVGVTQERDKSRPALRFQIHEWQRWGPEKPDRIYYRLDVCGGRGAVDDATILSGRGQGIFLTPNGLISYSDSWSGVNVTAKDALDIIRTINKLSLAHKAYPGEPSIPTLKQFSRQKGWDLK